jgi:tRNA modification GTPase
LQIHIFFIVKANKSLYLFSSLIWDLNRDNITIFAPATPVGESSVTVIRISGMDAFGFISQCFTKSKTELGGYAITETHANTVHHGYIFDDSEIIDEAVITVFKAPNSYTGEDVIEISSHGGSYIYRKINSLLTKLGCEHAEPGEFSKRAFLNGKIDLAQAEAISDLIKAKTELASKAAISMLKGELSSKIKILKEKLINYCSLVELELDFSEEGLEIIDKQKFISSIDNIIQSIEKLTNTYESGRIIHDGVNLAIVGIPNAGKSTIFNYLLNDSRAIVSEIPGTTRDFLQEPLIMGGLMFNLIDTAGIRETIDVVEKEGVRRSRLKIEQADIVLNIIDLTSGSFVSSIDENGNSNKVINVYNKTDLVRKSEVNGLCVSAKTGVNMDKLEQVIIDKARALINPGEVSEIFITNQRHRNCLLKSCEYLVNAKKLAEESAGNELISFEIREAMLALEEIIGKTTNVDILNNIFSKFCIGK